MSICYPPDTDWSCAFTEDELTALRADEVSAPRLELAEAFGWSVLASLTAYQIGTCPVTVRPCAARCNPSGGSYRAASVSGGPTPGVIGRFSPYISGGVWYNGCGHASAADCSCTALSEVRLPGPVGRVVSVMLDGVAVPSSAYRVDNGHLLVRLDGETWPACQDMTADGETAGFAVTYYRGAAPNAMTRAAAGRLAFEFYQSCVGGDCLLPDNVTRATRAGESYEFAQTDFPDGKTSIPEVDAVVRIYNPYGLKTPPAIYSPDVRPNVRVASWRG